MSAIDDKNTVVELSALEELPAELQLMIFKHLPAKQIQLNRRISRQFHDLLDLPGNQRMCTRDSVKRSLDRLRRLADFYFNSSIESVDADGYYTAFWDLLQDFIRQYGIPKTEADLKSKYWTRLCASTELWLHRRSQQTGHLRLLRITKFLSLLLILHAKVHMSNDSHYKLKIYKLEEDVRANWSYVKPFLGPTGTVDVLFDRIHNGIFPNTEWYAPAQALPSQRHWPRADWPSPMSSATRNSYYDQAYATLATVFGVPAIPGWMPLHYCFRDEWAPADDLSPVKHAAILEGMDLRWR